MARKLQNYITQFNELCFIEMYSICTKMLPPSSFMMATTMLLTSLALSSAPKKDFLFDASSIHTSLSGYHIRHAIISEIKSTLISQLNHCAYCGLHCSSESFSLGAAFGV